MIFEMEEHLFNSRLVVVHGRVVCVFVLQYQTLEIFALFSLLVLGE
jgi:hypothetical protein